MRAVTLSEMVQWTAADPVGSLQPDRALQAVATDSRSIDEGALFVALRGEHFDGHDFVEDAFARGAMRGLSGALLARVGPGGLWSAVGR